MPALNWKDRKALQTALWAIDKKLALHIQYVARNGHIDGQIHRYASIAHIADILRTRRVGLTSLWDLAERPQFRATLELTDGAIQEAVAKGDTLAQRFANRFLEGIARVAATRVGLYGASFCIGEERAALWRDFGDQGRGARLSINPKAVRRAETKAEDILGKPLVIPMRYDADAAKDRQRDAVREVFAVLARPQIKRLLTGAAEENAFLRELALHLAVWTMFNATVFKTSEFAEEAELRLLILEGQERLEGLLKTEPGAGQRFLPYHFEVPLTEPEAIAQITVGPLAPADAEQDIARVLADAGYPPLSISRSDIAL